MAHSTLRNRLEIAIALLQATTAAPARTPAAPAPEPAPAKPGPAKPAKPAKPKLPATPKRPVTDEYHGTKVTEDYRWLENWDDPEVKAWSTAQDAVARAWLDSRPGIAKLRARITELDSGTSPDYFGLTARPGVVFAYKEQPPRQQPFIVALGPGLDAASERSIVDPNILDPSGSTAIDWFVPSLDGKKLAVSMSTGGSEDGSLHVFDVATGKELDKVIPRVQYGTAGGSVAWNAAGTGLWYTRYPAPGERPAEDVHFYQQIYFHTLGQDPAKDVYVAGKDFPRIAEIFLSGSRDGKHVLAAVANGDGGEFAHYLYTAARPKAGFVQFTRHEDSVSDAAFGPADAPGLFVLSRKDAPRGKILSIDLAKPVLATAKVIVPMEQGGGAIDNFAVGKSLVYVNRLAGGPSQLLAFPRDGKTPARDVPILPISSVRQIVALDGDEILFRNHSFIHTQAWYRWGAKPGEAPLKTSLARVSPADFSDTEVTREMVTSKDGAQVPMTLIYKKGLKRDGNAPTILYGYGGYGVNITPGFYDLRRLLVERGGVWAIANIRGGGEFGEDWHLAGNLTKTQNVFDDFAACAQALVKLKITRPARLALMGGSNGGLLMGATLTQQPKLAAAVVSYVGIYDMLRVELSPNGAFNVTEFGTVKDPAQFAALYAYSPYHHVKDKTQYPAILMLTGANDPRVDPMNSRKMVARLQASGTKKPVFLRTNLNAGHGIGTSLSDQIDEDTHVYAFLFDVLKVK